MNNYIRISGTGLMGYLYKNKIKQYEASAMIGRGKGFVSDAIRADKMLRDDYINLCDKLNVEPSTFSDADFQQMTLADIELSDNKSATLISFDPQRIKDAVYKSGYNPYELSQLIGCGSTYLHKVMNGKVGKTSRESLEKLANKLDLPEDYFTKTNNATPSVSQETIRKPDKIPSLAALTIALRIREAAEIIREYAGGRVHYGEKLVSTNHFIIEEAMEAIIWAIDGMAW